MTYTRDHAVLPSKNILMFIALICAVLFFANVVPAHLAAPGRRDRAAGALGDPARHASGRRSCSSSRSSPRRADKEAPYIDKNIQATRAAYDVADSTVGAYDGHLDADARASSPPTPRRCRASGWSTRSWSATPSSSSSRCAATTPCPACSTSTATRSTASERDVVVAAREMNLDGLPDAQKNWANEHTVYTHGYGMIAAYGNQQDAEDKPVRTTTASRSGPRRTCRRSASSPTPERRAATGRRSTSASTARLLDRRQASRAARSRRARRAAGQRHARLSRTPTPTRARTASAIGVDRSTSCSTR